LSDTVSEITGLILTGPLVKCEASDAAVAFLTDNASLSRNLISHAVHLLQVDICYISWNQWTWILARISGALLHPIIVIVQVFGRIVSSKVEEAATLAIHASPAKVVHLNAGFSAVGAGFLNPGGWWGCLEDVRSIGH